MLSRYDIKYIIKKILIGTGIIILVSMFNACEVHALEYSGVRVGDIMKATYCFGGNNSNCTNLTMSSYNLGTSGYISQNIALGNRTYTQQFNLILDDVSSLTSYSNFYFTIGLLNGSVSAINLGSMDGSCQIVNSFYGSDDLSSWNYANISCNYSQLYNDLTLSLLFTPKPYQSGTTDFTRLWVGRWWTVANDSDSIENAIKQQTDEIKQNQNSNTQKEIDNANKNHKETMDTITNPDTSGANESANSFFNGFDNNDYGLSDVIKMPLTFINNITSNSCSNLILPIPFVNQNFELPCMNMIYKTYFGSFLTLYQTITFGIVAYWVVIHIFAMVKGFKDPENDRVEVFDL